MAGHARLRRITDPVVAAKPAGVRIRTRIHPTAEEAAALIAIGEFLGSHTHHEACRSTGKHPPAAANTVRAAQDSLLLTNQER